MVLLLTCVLNYTCYCERIDDGVDDFGLEGIVGFASLCCEGTIEDKSECVVGRSYMLIYYAITNEQTMRLFHSKV